MAVGTPVGGRGAAPRVPRGGRARWWPALPVALAVVGTAALALPWWRPDAGPVLLGGPGPPAARPPDTWTGVQVAGPRSVVLAVLVVAAVVAAVGYARGGPALPVAGLTAAAGGAVLTGGDAALADWGSSDAVGPWVAGVAGLACLVAVLLRRTRRTWAVLGLAVLAAALTVAVPGGQRPPQRAAVGPFLPVAALVPGPPRTGSAGLPGALADTRPAVVGGAPRLVGPAGVVVADPRGRARVLAGTDRGAPPPLGVVGGRAVRWASADTLAVTPLRADEPAQVLVRDVGAVSPMGPDGTLWLRSDVDPPGTVRRLDPAVYAGEQRLSATYLPVVTIQSPRGEPPVDVRAVLPVPGGALRVADVSGSRQLQLLSGTAAGVAVTPVPARAPCGTRDAPTDLRALTADASGVWYPSGERLVHLDPDGTRRAVAAPLPGPVAALVATGDGALLLTARDAAGDALWRLPDAAAALAAPADPPGC